MSHIIPGGRQRASSDGDVLEDEEDTINASGVLDRLTEAHRNVSRSAILSTTDDSDDSRSCTETNRTNTLTNKKKSLRAKLSFKSVKKAVSRALQKDSLFGSASSLNKEEMPATVRTSSAAGVWTPTLRRRAGHDETDRTDSSHHEYRPHRDVVEGPGTDSVSRPLITDPGMLIAKWERTPGNVGLFNHGNTCFMNAVLQCLSHTDSFSEYFIADLYKDDLKNTRNSAKKIGSKGPKGDVTEQLGLLLKCLWTEKYNSEISIDFKAIVGKYNTQYKGNSQHDAQEFLLWLLDRVHEDLMLLSPSHGKKKGKQTKNVVGPSRSQSDQELAEAAEGALNSSFVSKLFQALHRSSLTCPHCNKHSNTFDPYLCVSLPLPQKCLRAFFVTVVARNEQPREVMIGLSLNEYDTVKELRDAVAADMTIPANQLVLCELSNDGFYATFSNEQPLSDVPAESSHVYAIQMNTADSEAAGQSRDYDTPTVQILLLHVEMGPQKPERFCSPEVIQVSREINMRNLQKDILSQLGDAVKPEVFQQRLHSLFKLLIVDGSSRKTYLPQDVEMPLFTQTVDRVLSMFGEEFGPQHLKLIAEWEPDLKEAVIQDDAEHFVEHVSVGRVKSTVAQPVTISLDECFQLYTQEEKLAGEDAWLCPHCKKPQKGATKTLKLWSLPEVLVLHLKRFKQTGMRRNKLNMLVNFPVEDLDMARHMVQQGSQGQCHDDMIYDLIGVANHYGNMMGGHYTAFCKNTVDGSWQEFDDRRVTALPGDQVVTKAAYILFYQRRSLTKLINQHLHTGIHWVFSLENLTNLEKSGSPQRPYPSPHTKRGDGYGEDLRQASTATFIRRPFSKEWNGPSSPTRRPTNRPLTPQPQRRHISFEMDNYETSPTVIKPKLSFRPTRPTLSRQVSDAAVSSKRRLTQDPGMADGLERHGDLATDSGYGTGHSSSTIQPQPLQVQLPPKASTHTPDVMGSGVPRARNSDILQPQKVQLPPEDGLVVQLRTATDFKGTNLARSSSLIVASSKVTDITRSSSQSSRSPSSSSYHSPPSVEFRVVDSPSFRPYQQDNQAGLRSPHQAISIPPRSDRPWQYESQSSQSSQGTQSSQDSHSPKQDLAVTKIPFTNGQETFDWRQPEAGTGVDASSTTVLASSGLQSKVRHSSGSGSGSARPASSARQVSAKPPIPPKTITSRTSDWKKAEATRVAANTTSSGTSIMLRPVPTTSPSLTSPPSPAPKDTARDIQRRSSHREVQQPSEALSAQVERRREEQLWEVQKEVKQPERDATDDRRGPWERESPSEQVRPREKFIEISGENFERRRRSHHLDQQKFATIARGNRDARSEPRDVIVPPMVPRSATDHNIQFANRNFSSPTHLSQQTQRSLVPVTRHSPQSDRTSFSGGRSEWDRIISSERDSVQSAPLYTVRDHSNSMRVARPPIYRGPMFQARRPRKSNEAEAAPSLRESSV